MHVRFWQKRLELGWLSRLVGGTGGGGVDLRPIVD
jgi:hypothetical protein